jgi:hypothetical protein
MSEVYDKFELEADAREFIGLYPSFYKISFVFFLLLDTYVFDTSKGMQWLCIWTIAIFLNQLERQLIRLFCMLDPLPGMVKAPTSTPCMDLVNFLNHSQGKVMVKSFIVAASCMNLTHICLTD